MTQHLFKIFLPATLLGLSLLNQSILADGQSTATGVVANLTVSSKTISSVSLTWNMQPGNSSLFIVNWTGDNVSSSSNTSNLSYTVTGLPAGVNYTFSVTAVAVDGQTTGAPNQISAFTNPDVVTILNISNHTTSSVYLTWNKPTGNSSLFIINWTGDSVNVSSNTSNLSYTVTGLTAGVNYTFSVTAVAADGQTTGAPTQISTFTRPDIVKNHSFSGVTNTSANLDWTQPSGERSFFRVQWITGNMSLNSSTYPTAFNITKLQPGTNYTFTVSAVAADNTTEGFLVGLSTCTGASPVFNINCEGPNRTATALLNITWINPPGNNNGFNISLNESFSDFVPSCNPVCNYIFSRNLQYFSSYTVIISTQGCGESGISVFTCRTGITGPPVPSNPDEVVKVVTPMSETVITLEFSHTLLNSSNGPIQAYGVLLSTDFQSNISSSFLTKTYNNWKQKNPTTYLTVLKLNENSIRSEVIQIKLGNNNVSDVLSNTDYKNGPLSNQEYRVALVLFTYMEIKDRLVDIQQSVFSVTPFASITAKPLDSLSNTVTIVLGVLLPIICSLIIITIICNSRRLWHHHNFDQNKAVSESIDLQPTYCMLISLMHQDQL
ncbi:receptor-type tyrosine-protein phosphatase eta-like isoform X1 [Clarias gariepinus]|uniref:receptor-type tyrosine-protein phosphatase eta-like isoform X1 n=1 Tax=Clarias gariepinus TaxID=13013 RepID=UPI00234C7F24|nr:receptor-type tyrosine-protein phosphatase eta-like isoform X1 [Clarias gariepinus]